jgi:intracellular multiplication protein IcmD
MRFLKGLKRMLVKQKFVLLALSTLGLLAFLAPELTFANVKQGVSMAAINQNVTDSLQNMASIIHAVSILGGIAFFVAFAFKAKQHRDNPTQVTIGQPLMYLFLAIILATLPWFISSSKQVVYGTSASVSQWDHSQMNTLFGNTSSGNSGEGSGGTAGR